MKNEENKGPAGTEGNNWLSSLSIGRITGDARGIVEYLNDQAVKDLEIESSAAAGKMFGEILHIHKDKKDVFCDLLGRVAAGEKSVEMPRYSYIRVKESGKKFYIEARLLGEYDGRGVLSKFHILFRNIERQITDRYILSMALAKTKIFPWFFDLDRNKMIIDPRWFTHLGYPVREGGILDVEEFVARVHPEDRTLLTEALAGQIAGNLDDRVYTYRLQRFDGTWEWFEAQSVYLGKVDGAPYRIVGVCQSVQEHKDIEHGLIVACDRARESDRLKSAVLANMSHEIRTPLNAIVGFSNLLTNDYDSLDKETTLEFGRLINTNTQQLLVLISDILDLSKIESNTMEFNFAVQSLNALLSDIYQAQVMNMPSGVELVVEKYGPDMRINTDPMRVKQVLDNLINNAVKFTTRGSIVFGYKPVADGNTVEFYVKDTGTGIPPEKQEQIFGRFVKLDTFVKGTGLGLSICKSIVEKLDGMIGVESEPGKGSTFRFSIRCRATDTGSEKEQEPAAVRTETPVAGKSKTILIAEDNASNYHLLSFILENHYRLVWAQNGKEAVELYEKTHPDLILMDIKMPVMDGLEAAEIIRRKDKKIPIVVLTAYVYNEDKIKAERIGCNEYLTKPVDVERLQTLVASF